MTREEIEAMPAGGETDAAVEQHVFGTVPREVRAGGSDETVTVLNGNSALADGAWDAADLRRYGCCPRYSGDVAAAWAVVDWLRGDGWHLTLATSYHPHPRGWACSVQCSNGPCARHGTDFHNWHGVEGVTAEAFPLAVCRAALMAVLVKGGGS